MGSRDGGAGRRGAQLAAAALALVFGVALMVTEAAMVLAEPTPAPATAVELDDDDAESALFTATDLAPGHPVAACIQVRHSADGAFSLRLHGRAPGSRLARALRLVVEAGDGGRFGDCAGFAGAALYDGTLGAFAERHRDFASGLYLDAARGGSATAFRFTVEVLDDNSLQGAEASATFTWEADAVPVPYSVITTPPVDGPAAPAGPVPLPSPADAPAASVEPAPVVEPLPPASGASAPKADVVPVRRGRSGSSLASLVAAVAGVLVAVAGKAAFPGGLVACAALFVIVQDRIDRRDPKLALAPVYPDPDLRFGGPDEEVTR